MTEEAKGKGNTTVMLLVLVVGLLLGASTGYYFGLEAKPRFSITTSGRDGFLATYLKLDNVTGQTWISGTKAIEGADLLWIEVTTSP